MLKKEIIGSSYLRLDIRKTETDEYYWVMDSDFEGIIRVSDYYDSLEEALSVYRFYKRDICNLEVKK